MVPSVTSLRFSIFFFLSFYIFSSSPPLIFPSLHFSFPFLSPFPPSLPHYSPLTIQGRKFEKGSESCSVSVGSSHGTNSWEVYKKRFFFCFLFFFFFVFCFFLFFLFFFVFFFFFFLFFFLFFCFFFLFFFLFFFFFSFLFFLRGATDCPLSFVLLFFFFFFFFSDKQNQKIIISDKKKFMCGVQCVQMNGQNIVLGETLLSGKGTQEVPLSPTTNAFCFLVNARAWYEKDEICR